LRAPLLFVTSVLLAGCAHHAAAPATATANAPATAADGGYRCNLLLGVAVTGEWFGAGFESVVDGARWEALTRPHTSLAEWADPANPAWALPPASPCAERAADPDRVLLVGMQWEHTTAAQWVASLSAVVAVIRARYPHARSIDLLTMIRAPGNVSCGNPMSVVPPFVDEAVAAVSARDPGLVRAGPRLEAPGCDAFKKGGPHFTPEGAAAMARTAGAYYAAEARGSR
jgi:hypothetical protein